MLIDQVLSLSSRHLNHLLLEFSELRLRFVIGALLREAHRGRLDHENALPTTRSVCILLLPRRRAV